jgi:putative DNA primase/helicase
MGAEFHGPCPLEDHAQPLAVIGEVVKCTGCGFNGGALEFLRAVGEPEPEALLANGHIWTPTLTKPTPPPPRYAFARIAARPDATVLITDSSAAAKVADEILTSYVAVAWPGGGSRWNDLDPLKGRSVLLWPSPEGMEAMQRLERVLADPSGLACTGKILTEGYNLTEMSGSVDELINWARGHVRPLVPPLLSPKNPAQVSDGLPPSSESEGNSTAGGPTPFTAPPRAPASGPDLSHAEPPPVHDTDFPPEASTKRPKRPRRLLKVVGGADEALDSIDPDSPPIPHELSESGIANHFVAMHKDKFRTVHEWAGKQGACWMAWDGSRWRREPSRVTAMQLGQVLAAGVKYWDIARGQTEAGKIKFESRKFIGAFLDLASYAPEFVATPDKFDADPMLLGTPAGTVDLTTGKLCAPDPDQYLTRQTSVSPEPGAHPLFDDVIRRASGGEQDMADYLWRWLGYLLTGLTKEKAFLYLHGKTDSGKTTLASAIAGILGNADHGGYAAQCDVEMFTESKLDKGNDKLAHLAGARFAYASEMEEGKNFKTALLKLATGGDTLHGRFLYADQFSFTATHKLWIFGNHKMHMKSSDSALLNRLHLLEYKDEFIVTAEERDNDFQRKLQAEYPAILASMIRATGVYLECNGLGRPERMSVAVEDYASSEDTLGQWIDDCLDLETEARTPSADAYQNFSRWAEREGAYVPSSKRFIQQLVDRGFAKVRSGGVRSLVGFKLKLGANLP